MDHKLGTSPLVSGEAGRDRTRTDFNVTADVDGTALTVNVADEVDMAMVGRRGIIPADGTPADEQPDGGRSR
jgi:hypothetical protein